MVARSPRQLTLSSGVITGRDPTSVLTYLVLLVITVAAWVQVLSSAMTVDDMRGMHMVMTPTLIDGLLYVGAWAVMMTAMMLPSALPMIGLYAAIQRNVTSPALKLVLPVTLFTLMYLALWAMTGIPMYFASVALSSMASDALPYGIAGVLLIAGVFQISPLKQVCLRHCRSPLGFFLGHWRTGWRGGLTIGWAHAVYCLGCCWALMVVLVAAGAMGLPWVLLIAVVVAAEKLLPYGEWIARLAGVGLMLLGVAVAVRPHLAMALRASGHAM
jgi:predicted metal-binding membrane protein